MADQSKPVRLRASDMAYLLQHAMLADKLPAAAATSDARTQFVMIDRRSAEAIRSELKVRLARMGFDDKYEPTNEGKFIEDLIDRLFGP